MAGRTGEDISMALDVCFIRMRTAQLHVTVRTRELGDGFVWRRLLGAMGHRAG